MPPIATNNFASANNAGSYANDEFSRYQQSVNNNNNNNSSSNYNNASSNEFSRYRAPANAAAVNDYTTYPSYGDRYNYKNDEKSSFEATREDSNYTNSNFNFEPTGTAPVNVTSSWLHGNDFSMTAGELFGTKKHNIDNGTEHEYDNLGNFSGVNFDQIKIGDQTMENVLKALDPKSKTSANSSEYFSNNLNGLNLDSSFITKKFSDHDFNMKPGTGYNTNANGYNNNNNNNHNHYNNNRYSDSAFSNNFDYYKPTNRSNIIKSHNAAKQNTSINFQKTAAVPHPQSTQFFSNPDESFVNMTLPAVDASMIFSSDKPKVPNFKNSTGFQGNDSINEYHRNTSNSNSNCNTEKDQFVTFAVQQYRMLASLNPEMMRSPENIEELAERETFKYWGKLFIEDRERQARIVLNMQKALTEALSSSAGRGPNVMAHLGAATGDFELETIGRYADQCRKKSQMISNYFNSKR